MTTKELANLIFPDVVETLEDLERLKHVLINSRRRR